MKQVLTTLVAVISMTCFAQEGFLKINTLSEGADFSFPEVVAANRMVQEKINIHLQLSELKLIRGSERLHVFERVTDNEGTLYGAKDYIQYDVLNNSPQNLSIKFNQSGCGLSCAYWVRYYNFNPRNGDRYVLRDFFDAENFTKFRDMITTQRQHMIAQQIKERQSEEAEIGQMLDYLPISIEQDQLYDFYFTNDSIFFDSENLLNKHDKGWDLEHITGFAIAEIKHLLNEYGKAALITGKQLESYRANSEPQLYQGRIHNLDVYLLMRPTYENNFEGIYTYSGSGNSAHLSGKLQGNEYQFKENDKELEQVAWLNFTKQGNTLFGSWTDATRHKKLPFTAKRVSL